MDRDAFDEDLGVDPKLGFLDGFVFEAVAKVVPFDESRCSLIVVGKRERKSIKRMLLAICLLQRKLFVSSTLRDTNLLRRT